MHAEPDHGGKSPRWHGWRVCLTVSQRSPCTGGPPSPSLMQEACVRASWYFSTLACKCVNSPHKLTPAHTPPPHAGPSLDLTLPQACVRYIPAARLCASPPCPPPPMRYTGVCQVHTGGQTVRCTSRARDTRPSAMTRPSTHSSGEWDTFLCGLGTGAD